MSAVSRPRASNLILASIPLVALDQARDPIASASGCVVAYRDLRVLLTVYHATGAQGNWAALDGYDPATGVRLLPLGELGFFLKGGLSSKFKPVDFAFVRVRDDFAPRWQHVTPQNGIEFEHPRTVLPTTLRAIPLAGVSYGFAGIVHADRASAALYGDTQVEYGISLIDEDEEWCYFALNHPHPGDDEYRGCSGAPILDSSDTLVALLVGRGKHPDSIRALPLAKYRAAVDLSLGLEPEAA
jgi:hypothetical protein